MKLHSIRLNYNIENNDALAEWLINKVDKKKNHQATKYKCSSEMIHKVVLMKQLHLHS